MAEIMPAGARVTALHDVLMAHAQAHGKEAVGRFVQWWVETIYHEFPDQQQERILAEELRDGLELGNWVWNTQWGHLPHISNRDDQY